MNPQELRLTAMGGEFIYKSFAQSLYTSEEVEDLFKNAHAEVLRIEEKFTEFKESIVTEINDSAGKSECPLDDELLYLLEESKRFFELSSGLFDPT